MAESWQYRAMVGAIKMYMQPPEVPFAMWQDEDDDRVKIWCNQHGHVNSFWNWNRDEMKYSAYQHAKSHADKLRDRDEIETAERIELVMLRNPDIMQRPAPPSNRPGWTHLRNHTTQARKLRPERGTALKSSKLVSARRQVREMRSSRKIRQQRV